MIETAKSGAEVLLVEGLATASLVNPEREAGQWADMQMGRLKATDPNEPVVVLGVGSGFHLKALMTAMINLSSGSAVPRLVAIDTCRASIEFARVRLPSVEMILADVAAGADSFFTDPVVTSVLTQAHTLLRHKPTISRIGQPLRVVETWMVGRTSEAFLAQLKLRPEIAAALNPARAAKVADAKLLSVRDLSKMWDISSELKSDRRIFRVLEELVR